MHSTGVHTVANMVLITMTPENTACNLQTKHNIKLTMTLTGHIIEQVLSYNTKQKYFF